MNNFQAYWKAYGGHGALIKSPYLWAAVVLTWALEPWWITDSKWPDTSLLIIPPLLGFTIGAMAVVLAFPTSRIFRHLAEEGRADSYYAQLAAKLVHFIIVQTAGIILALLGRAYCGFAIEMVAIFVLAYALLTAVAVAMALFNMALIYNESADLSEEE